MTALAALVALASVVCFAIVLLRSGILEIARAVPATATAGVTAMLDADLDDNAKEVAVRRAGLRLVGQAWRVAWRLALALAAVLLPIHAAELAGLVAAEASLAVLLRVDFIVAVSIAAVAAGWALRRLRKPARDEDTGATRARIADASGYAPGDRLMHALAFSGPRMHRALARLDDGLHARRLSEARTGPPIFITSLARGGTTALLNALHELPQIATHRYADMPFMSAPMLWARLAGEPDGGARRERSHGDGLEIGLQSPEAFDEIFWRLHWPEKYHDDRIDLWRPEDARPEAQAFLTRHFDKIALLRRPEGARDAAAGIRYLSKNNANVARLALLPRAFPGARVVVPLREPSAHAASLYRQHRNFLTVHAEDPFAERYMRDIGHLEFGALHRPIAFDLNLLSRHDPGTADYWLAYWLAAFDHVSWHAQDVLLIAQDDLRASPVATMDALMPRLGLDDAPGLDWARHFRAGADTRFDAMFDAVLLAEARRVYDGLMDRRVTPNG